MKILVLNLNAPYPPYDGGSITTIEFLKTIAAKHRVTFVGTFDPEADSVTSLRAHLLQYCEAVELTPIHSTPPVWGRWQQMGNVFTFPPSRVTRYVTPEYERIVESLLGDWPDTIICNTILTGQVIRHHPVRARKILYVVDVYGLMRKREYEIAASNKPSKVLKFIEWHKTSAYERQIWRLYDALIANSVQDADLIRKTCPRKAIDIIPTGIDIPHIIEESITDIDLLFVGKLNYPPNLDALSYFNEEILPLLRKDLPHIRVGIVGKSPVPQVEQIVSQSNNYALYPNVPDVGEFYRRAKVVIAPLRMGGGIKVKVLEALAFGKAIVSSREGIYGIPVSDGQEVAIGDTPEEFARAVLDLLRNPRRAAMLGANGRAMVAEKYEWSRVKDRYLRFVEEQSA